MGQKQGPAPTCVYQYAEPFGTLVRVGSLKLT